MKAARNFCLVAALLISAAPGLSQGFVNLNFESAVIVPDPSSPYYPAAVFASNAISGWTATGGFLGPNDVHYNTVSIGATDISILGTNGTPPAISGAYSVLLYGGSSAPSASISQSALVPVSAQSILFKAQYSGSIGALVVSLGGQSIPFYTISTGANYTLYGGDVSAYAGQNEQLMFSVFTGENFFNIDDIQFSSSPVPEPGTLALIALGGALFAIRRKISQA